jgi:hypothetical protein
MTARAFRQGQPASVERVISIEDEEAKRLRSEADAREAEGTRLGALAARYHALRTEHSAYLAAIDQGVARAAGWIKNGSVESIASDYIEAFRRKNFILSEGFIAGAHARFALAAVAPAVQAELGREKEAAEARFRAFERENGVDLQRLGLIGAGKGKKEAK